MEETGEPHFVSEDLHAMNKGAVERDLGGASGGGGGSGCSSSSSSNNLIADVSDDLSQW